MIQTINDPMIGQLKNQEGWWEGLWNSDGKFPIRILVELQHDHKQLPKRFHNFLDTVSERDAEFRHASAKSLLKLYNETWSEGEQINEVEFARRMKIDSISFDEKEDRVSVYYDDGDLFAGHAIKVDVTFDGTVLKADLP